jgi:glycosyltransferase involved in cell wall biosynthesis
MRNDLRSVLIVVPAYNEESGIEEVIAKLTKFIPKENILVIDDCSRDSTQEKVKEMDIKMIPLIFNLGIGGAVQAGFRYALIKNYDVTVQIDGDGQHDPAFLNELLKPLFEDTADIVIGSRYLEPQKGFKSTFLRNIGIRFFSFVTSIIIRERITDVTSGFRAYGKRCIKYLSEFYPTDFPDAEAVIDFKQQGFRIKEIPIVIKRRGTGKSSINMLKSLYYPFRNAISILAAILKRMDL